MFKEFVNSNFKVIMVTGGFLITLYVQHVANMQHLEELDARCARIEQRIEEDYKHIDIIKLDKSVFEATMQQFAGMREDMKEIRADLKEVLKKYRL